MTKKSIALAVKKAVATGNWIVRYDMNGVSHDGFRWKPLGDWTEAPDWTEEPICKHGLFGQGPEVNGFVKSGTRFVFCDTRGPQIPVNTEKVKVQFARILAIDELPAQLTKFGGTLNVRADFQAPALAEIGGWLNVRADFQAPALAKIGSTLDVRADFQAPALAEVTGIICGDLSKLHAVNLKTVNGKPWVKND